MHARLLLAVCALLIPAAAAADVRVMCYGDAITAGADDMFAPENSYPAQLQRLRPDLEVVNEGRGGDVSGNLDRLRAALADWPPQLVILMLGTNDAVCSSADNPACEAATATPEGTVGNLLRMAEEARAAGARVIILTPPPAVCDAACEGRHDVAFTTTMRDAFTERVAAELLHIRPPTGVRVANLRGKFTAASWQAVSLDGLHPTAEGNRVIAGFVAALIPKAGIPREVAISRPAKRDPPPEAARTPTAEPDPFVRQPPGGPSR